MAEFTARDGSVIRDGEAATLVLAHGVYEEVHERQGHGQAGTPVERPVTGTVRCFQQREYRYNWEHVAIGVDEEDRWEITTDDPQMPAIGFLPEHVLTRLS